MKKRPITINIEHLVKEINVECTPGSKFTQDQLDMIESQIASQLCKAIESTHFAIDCEIEKYSIPGWAKEKLYRRFISRFAIYPDGSYSNESRKSPSPLQCGVCSRSMCTEYLNKSELGAMIEEIILRVLSQSDQPSS